MSESELKCDTCQKPAHRLLIRVGAGDADDRRLTCGSDACKPPEGEWSSLPIDISTLAKEHEERNP